MARQKPVYTSDEFLKRWLTPKLRNFSRQWPGRKAVRNRDRVRIQVGTFKNGRPQMKFKWKCVQCEGLFERHETHVDHIEPAVDPKVGFQNWDIFIRRLFCGEENLQTLCETCHHQKSAKENEERRLVKKTSKLKKAKRHVRKTKKHTK